jgi:hypothetical protein
MIISLFFSFAVLAQASHAADISAFLNFPRDYNRAQQVSYSGKQYTQPELIRRAGALPEQLESLDALRTYVAHYAWWSAQHRLKRSFFGLLPFDTIKEPCLRVVSDKKDHQRARVEEILARAQDLRIENMLFKDDLLLFFLSNPVNEQDKQSQREYFATFLMKNNAALLPGYQDLIRFLSAVLSVHANEALQFLNDEKNLSNQELARLVGVSELSPQQREQFIKLSKDVFNDVTRLLNFSEFLSKNIDEVQVVELYFFAEQSFHFLNNIEPSLVNMLNSGYFFRDDTYEKKNPPHPDIAKFFRHPKSVYRNLYLMMRAVAFSLRDFADKFRAQVGLPPIPADTFAQKKIIRNTLRMDETLPLTGDFLLEKGAQKVKKSMLTVEEQAAETHSYLEDSLVFRNDRAKQKAKTKKNRKQPKSRKQAMTMLSEPQEEEPVEAAALETEEQALEVKPSIGVRIANLLSDVDNKRFHDLFARKPAQIKADEVHELSMAVYRALVTLNKAHRAAEFLKRACDSRIFTKGKDDGLLSKVSLEHHLLPYLLQNIVHPDFDRDAMLKESDFLRERVLTERVLLHGDDIDVEQLARIEKNLQEGEHIIKDAPESKRRVLLVNLAHAWHKLAIATERAKGIEHKNGRVGLQHEKIVALLKQALPYFDRPNAAPVTVLEAYLLGFYLKKETSPHYERLTLAEIEKIKQRAAQSMRNPAKKYEKVIHEVSPSGQKLGEHRVAPSLYHMVTNNELGDYIVVRFEKPVKDRKIPLFVYYNDTIYRTDVFGGSRLKPNPAKDDFGSLIGIPLRAADFFNQWFTSTSSFWYGQRAFMPAQPDQESKYAKGDITIQTIPDNAQFRVIDNFIVQDGFGYIKESLAEDLKLKRAHRSPDDRDKFVAFQALHGYAAAGRKEAAQELFLGAQRAYLDPKFNRLSDEEKAQVLMATRPKKTAVGVPVSGDNVILPKDVGFEALIEEGITIGRNPYSAKRSQVVDREHIELSARLKDMQVFQYTMTGYVRDQDRLNGSFFKGLLGVIPDRYWPKEYEKSDILVSSKDQKLNQAWRSADDKYKDQNNGQRLSFAGSILVKEEYNRRSLIGLPVAMAEKLSGDYDGDPYDIMPNKGYRNVVAMIQKEHDLALASSKIAKPFIPKETTGNFDKIFDVRKPINQSWNAINNRFNYLLPDERRQFCQRMAKDHILHHYMGTESTKSDQLISLTDEQLVISEIQLGLKVGEDVYKADCDIKTLIEREQAYQRALADFNADPSIPYGNGLKRRLKEKQGLKDALAPTLTPKQSANVVHKATRALARYLAGNRTYDGYVSDDNEIEGEFEAHDE